MSDETHGEAEQLFDSQTDEVAEDATDTEENPEDTSDDEVFDDNSTDEQEQEGLDLSDKDTNKTASKAEESKLKQIKVWQDKIDNGEITLAKLPKAQRWLKKYLSAPEQEVDHKAIAKELAREAIREERAEVQYEDLKNTLNSVRLTKEQKELIKDKFKFLMSRGISKFEALSLASEFARVDFTGMGEKRRRMSIPKPSTKKSTGEIDWDQPFAELVKNVPKEKIAEHLKSLVR